MRFFFLLIMGIMSAGAVAADSCWWHNGSLMRLADRGSQRAFYYEEPRSGLRSVGVRRGTLLFNGTKNGNWYSGWASVFSPGCAPLEYWVEGPVASNQREVSMRGTREVHRNCQWTGDYATDVLVFTYSHQC
jgi:hypothetical protein